MSGIPGHINYPMCKESRAVFLRKSLPAAAQRFPLSVFLVEVLPYFRQPLHSIGSAFSRHCHHCQSRENGGTVVNNVSLYVETM